MWDKSALVPCCLSKQKWERAWRDAATSQWRQQWVMMSNGLRPLSTSRDDSIVLIITNSILLIMINNQYFNASHTTLTHTHHITYSFSAPSTD